MVIKVANDSDLIQEISANTDLDLRVDTTVATFIKKSSNRLDTVVYEKRNHLN